MIWESFVWKRDLAMRARFLRAKTKQRRWTQLSRSNLEFSVMQGFFSVRKLMDSCKLTADLESRKWPVKTYGPGGKGPTKFNWHKIDELFQLDCGRVDQRTARDLCNMFIHSYIFLPRFSNDGFLTSIFVASDYRVRRELSEIQLRQVAALFGAVANDEVNMMSARLDTEKRDYVITSRLRAT